ncbi:MAG: hypothetical protein HYY06_15140 [Deltaproteobacteria bacterium]|nr:hypothetical protein [Deltaproteobacteria bacterium]
MLAAVSTRLAHPLCGRPLALVAASRSSVEAVASGAADELTILPPIHISEDDSYLVVSAGPDVYGEAGLRRIVAGGVGVRGELSIRPGAAVLSVTERFRIVELFDRKPFDVIVPVRPGSDLLGDLDRIPVAPAAEGRLFGAGGLDRILRSRDLVAKSWELHVPKRVRDTGAGQAPFLARPQARVGRAGGFEGGRDWEREAADAPDPTWAWSRRGSRAVNVHLMVFGDYEERYALINPVQILLPGARAGRRGVRAV